MKRKYRNEFRYCGLSKLDHCEGPEWKEVWTEPVWETKAVSTARAKFLWKKIQKECPWLCPLYIPKFVKGRKYHLTITEIDNGDHCLAVYREGK